MPVNVQWHDEFPKTLHMHLEDSAKWDDFHSGIEQVLSFALMEPGYVCIIITAESEPPPSNVIANFRQVIRRVQDVPNIAFFVSIMPQTKLPLVRKLWKLSLRTTGADQARFVVTESWDETRRLITNTVDRR